MFAGKKILVTGGTKGIGLAAVLKLKELGAEVFFTGTSVNSVANIQELHNVRGFVMNLSDLESINSLIKEIESQKIELDILINNGGIMKDSQLIFQKTEDIFDNINTNLIGTIYLTKAVSKQFIRRRRGIIVNIASIVGIDGHSGQTSYSASKAGIIGFTKSLSQELAPLGIRVNSVSPGIIQTELLSHLSESQKEQIMKKIDMKRIGVPNDVVNLIVFLASNESNYITGQNIRIDGGLRF